MVELSKELRREKCLYQAWRHIRSRALRSMSSQIREEAREFDANAHSRLRSIQDRLRGRTFQFSPQRGIPVSRSGKRPRPIILAPIDNRVVQRAMLDTLQSHSPALADVMNAPFSVGGIEGVDSAIGIALYHMAGRKQWYVRSDIKDFFGNVDRSQVIRFISEATSDEYFTDLFARATETELSNPGQVKDVMDVFPIGDKGVAQGSALSPLIGNIALRDFDEKMNGRGVVCIRYIDDFLLLAPGRNAAVAAFSSARDWLRKNGLDVYSPDEDPKKASIGSCNDGVSFLGFDLNHGRVQPTAAARTAFLAKVSEVIADGKEAMLAAIAGNNGSATRQRYSQTLTRVDRIIKGWGEAFSICNNPQIREHLDCKVDELLKELHAFRRRLQQGRSARESRRLTGVTLLTDIKQRGIPVRMDRAHAAVAPLKKRSTFDSSTGG